MSRSVQSLLTTLDSNLTATPRNALDACRRLCDERALSLFLVGGAVRDLQLGRGHIDFDLAIEGDVAAIASQLAAELGGRAVYHGRFGTATVTGAGFHFDLAQTRSETYARPGALPSVELGAGIEADLARRDFTINSMALQLTPSTRLIDPHGGLADLDGRLVRTLHTASFQDDATRMLRAVRYATRLGFEIERGTLDDMRRSLGFLNSISGPRLRRELSLTFREPEAPASSLRAAGLGILSAIAPPLGIDAATAHRWADALLKRHYAPLDELGFCLIADPGSEEDVAEVSERLRLKAREHKALASLLRLRGLSDKLDSASDVPSRAAALLDGHASAAVWALSILDRDGAGEACARYLESWQAVRPTLTGDDLLALGVATGEAVGVMLRRLREARMDGELADRNAELDFVRAELGARNGGQDGESTQG